MIRVFGLLKSRLSHRPDSEHIQALVRIAITLLFCIYLGWQVSGGAASARLFATWWILIGELSLSVGLLVSILITPRISHIRRWLGMLADYSAIGAVMYLQGETASPLYGVYLWVTIGNGLRFGPYYLYFATALAAMSFMAVCGLTPYWKSNAYLSWGLLVGLIAIPLYFASLLKALTHAIDNAKRANKAKSRFLANMSHELRTPLNAILGMTTLLSASKLESDQRESADVIHTSAQALLSLIEDVLDISAIEAGKFRRQDEDFNLPDLLARVQQVLLPQAQAKDLELQISTDIGIPSELHGDASHISQVLMNLLQNAVKFTPSGKVALQVCKLGQEGRIINLRFSVRDTGIGIPEEARTRIFLPFEQVDSGRDRRYGGSGLGTSIAKTLTELMGGKIDVEANLGGGTHFWIDIPLHLPKSSADKSVGMDAGGDSLPATKKTTAQPGKVIAFDDPFVRHRARVRSMQALIVDDQSANRIVLQRLLDRAGHRTIFAEDGEQALDSLTENTPDLLIVDLHMPGLSGLDVIRQARVLQAGRPRTPIVVLSADATVEAKQEAESAGAYAYLTKPVVVSRLLDVMQRIATSAPAADSHLEEITPHPSGYSILHELAAMDMDEKFMRDFVEQCLRDIGRCMSQLQRAAVKADWEGLREHAHAMRGVAENLGTTKLVDRCRQLMRMDSVHLAREAQALTRDLDNLIEETARQARAEISNLLPSNVGHQNP